jgi:hypothetical protein
MLVVVSPLAYDFFFHVPRVEQKIIPIYSVQTVFLAGTSPVKFRGFVIIAGALQAKFNYMRVACNGFQNVCVFLAEICFANAPGALRCVLVFKGSSN